MKYDVVGLGACGVDIKVKIPKFPAPGVKNIASESAMFAGGVTANNIAQCAKLGMRSAWLGALGDDHFADYLIKEFKKDKVDVPNEIRLSGSPTQLFFIWNDVENNIGMIGIPGSNHAITPAIVEKEFSEAIKKASHFHTEVAVIPLAVALAGARIAKQAGVRVFLDIDGDPYNLISNDNIGTVKELNELLSLIDVLKMTKSAALALSKSHSINRISVDKILALGPQILAVTDASSGCIISDKENFIKIQGIKIKAVETVGAGDAFMGGLSYALLEGYSLKDAGEFANACGSFKCLHKGIRSGGSMADIQAFLKVF